MPKIDMPRSNGQSPDSVPSEDAKNYSRLFEAFGLAFTRNSGDQRIADNCPYCEGPKFHVRASTGQYICFSKNTCGNQGNAYTFINDMYERAVSQTSDDLLHPIRDTRGWSVQTLKRNGVAWSREVGKYLIPFKSKEGTVQNLLRYDVSDTGRYAKLLLPGLPQRLFGLDALSGDLARPLIVCEGPFDAISLDAHLTSKKSRDRYDIVAVPSAGTFNEAWLEHFKGRREVRLCFDNDKAGRDGQDRIVKMARDRKVDVKLLALKWPEAPLERWPEEVRQEWSGGVPEKSDIGDLVRRKVNVIEFTREHCVKVSTATRLIAFVRGDSIKEERTEWLWLYRIPFGSLVSLSGPGGTSKSTIARDIAARCTAGLPMPLCEKRLPPFDVMWFTSEDPGYVNRDLIVAHGGDLTRFHCHDIASGSEPIDILERLEEVESTINAMGVRLVVIDAFNSFVTGDIATDSKARRTVSGRIQALARKTGACIIAIRNLGKGAGGSNAPASANVLGAASVTDVSRCVLNTAVLPLVDAGPPSEGGLRRPKPRAGQPRRLQLEFEKVSGANEIHWGKPLQYGVVDLSEGAEDKSHLRRIIWLGEGATEVGERLDEKREQKKVASECQSTQSD